MVSLMATLIVIVELGRHLWALRLAQHKLNRLGRGGFDLEVTMVPILSNLQFTLGFKGLGMAKLLWLPSQFLHAPSGSTRDVRATQRRAGAHLKNPKELLWAGFSTTPPSPKKKAGPNAQAFLIKHHFLRPEPPKGFRPEAQENKRGGSDDFSQKKLWNVEAENHEMKEKQINFQTNLHFWVPC